MIQAQAPTIEAIRRRARQRLIGAGVLVLAGVIVLPLLFDKQPRPVPVDVVIEIPGRNDLPPLTATPAAEPAAVLEPVKPNTDVMPTVPQASTSAPAPVAPTPAPAPVPQTKPAAAPPAPPVNTPAAKAPAPAASATAVRVVVQVGAFAEQARAQEVRQRLERAGFKTYTQVAETSEGRRIRVRVGPFDSRAEADRVAARIKQLGFQPTVLTL
jgi:DedD protein